MSHSGDNNTVFSVHICWTNDVNDFIFANHFTNDFDLKSVGKNDFVFDFKSF